LKKITLFDKKPNQCRDYQKNTHGHQAGAIVLGAVTIPVFAKPADRSLNGGGEVVEDNYKISFEIPIIFS